ncbi:hypothetical protein ABPG74_017572 [Tetrahymena malaccensis]
MYLEEGKTFTCQTSCSSLFSNLSNSISQTCTFMPQQMCDDQNLNTGLDRFFQKLCACPKGQYLDSKKKKCQNCLSYCNSCKPEDANTCNKDDNQTYFGQCDLKAFNNGKQCVSNFMKMINHQNQQFQIDLSKIACLQTPTNEKDYSLQDNAFKLGHYSNSFFFQLNFNLNKEDFLSDKIYTICYLTNSDMHIFSIIAVVDKTNKQIKLQFIDSSLSVLLNAHIEDKVDTWIGLYYDYLGIYLLVKYGYQQTSFYSQNIKNIIKQNLENPLLVIGVKSPLFPFSQNLCGSLGSNNWIISGDQSMRYFVDILFEFSDEDLELILDFYFPNYWQNFQQNQLYIINKNDPSKTLTMYLTNPNVFNFDQFKGIKLDSNYGIIDLSQQLNKIPFVIKISITANNYINCNYTSYEFLKLISEQQNIIIFRIGAQYVDEQYFLEICTIENFIKVQQLNFSDMLAYIRCNVILNYIQDEIDIQIPQSLLTSPPKFYDIKLGNSTLLFSNPDPCFVYINRKNMTCIYPKQEYALKDGNVVSQTNCNNNIKQNDPLYFYNKYTMTCQNSQIIIPNCINIDITNKKCNQCIDNQMILSKNCLCPDGMYQDQSSQVCIKCSIQCKTCSINKDNCLECKGNNQIPPHCECKIQNYYKDSNSNCLSCSQQCSSCTQNSDYCLTCSEGRVNPPLCYCNPTLFLNTMSDPIKNSCIRRNCPNKCQACDDNNQCISCRGDRINPPQCLCSQGYYDDPLFDRQLCQSSYDFNSQLSDLEEQKQNNTIQMGDFELDDFDIESMILEMINNKIGLIYSRPSQNNHQKVDQFEMQDILSQYQIIEESSNGISSYVKSDGSSAIRFNIFCQSKIVDQILFSIKSKICQVYYDIENFGILLITDTWFTKIAQQNTEYYYEKFYSEEIPLENLLKTKFENQQKLFNKLGLTKKTQLHNCQQIKNKRFKIDLIESFECLDEDLQFQSRRLKNECYVYYTQSYDLNLLEGLIIGPQGTPFEGFIFTLKIRIPEQYPYQPPQIAFNKSITHQNINTYGEICLDILSDQWCSIFTLQETLIRIIELFKESQNCINIKLPYQQNLDLYKMLLRQEYIIQGNQNVIIDYQQQPELQQLTMDYYEYDESYISGLDQDDEYID